MKNLFTSFIVALFKATLLSFCFVTTANAYDFYVKNSDGVVLYYNIVSSEMSNRQVELTRNTDETIEKEVKIPATVSKNGKKYKVVGIGDGAFKYQSVPSVTIPSSVTYIGESAFEYCTNLTKVEIPESIERIGARAFYNCSRLADFSLPNSVTDIGVDAFIRLNDLQSGKQAPLCSDKVFAYCHTQCEDPVVVPEGIKTIASSAFGVAFNTSSVILPSSVDSICMYAFYSSQENISLRITTLSVKATLPPTCDDAAFEQAIYEQATLQVSDATPAILEAYKSAEGWKNFKNIVAVKLDGDRPAADVNGDGTVNSADVVEIYNYIVGGSDTQNCDVNGDGVVNSADVVEIYNYIVGSPS